MTAQVTLASYSLALALGSVRLSRNDPPCEVPGTADDSTKKKERFDEKEKKENIIEGRVRPLSLLADFCQLLIPITDAATQRSRNTLANVTVFEKAKKFMTVGVRIQIKIMVSK